LYLRNLKFISWVSNCDVLCVHIWLYIKCKIQSFLNSFKLEEVSCLCSWAFVISSDYSELPSKCKDTGLLSFVRGTNIKNICCVFLLYLFFLSTAKLFWKTKDLDILKRKSQHNSPPFLCFSHLQAMASTPFLEKREKTLKSHFLSSFDTQSKWHFLWGNLLSWNFDKIIFNKGIREESYRRVFTSLIGESYRIICVKGISKRNIK
jgi:hypothetical protein